MAVDPAAPADDRLVGYEVVRGSVTGATMATFLARLAAAGIQPAEVSTAGSSFYPRVLAAVWPQAAHQRCLFHQSRRLIRAVEDVVKHLQTTLPVPEIRVSFVWGAARGATLPQRSSERWQTRHAARPAGVAQVATLTEQGVSQHAIARQVGINRRTVHRWLAESRMTVQTPQETAEGLPLRPMPRHRPRPTPALLDQIRTLRAQGQPYRQIAATVRLHHSPVAPWLARLGGDTPSAAGPRPACASGSKDPAGGQSVGAVLAPPAPWQDGAQVHQGREALSPHRYLLLRRPAHVRATEQAQVDHLLNSPVGATLTVARGFLLEWWAIWRDAEGHKRSQVEAEARSTAWQDAPPSAVLAPLARARAQITPQRFAHLSEFLRQAQWEATNNGAERAGRAFRHGQAPHFNLRSIASLDAILRVGAYQRMEQARWPQPALAARCRRGHRRRRTDQDMAVA